MERNPTNTNAVASITTGVLSLFVPFIGLFLGILGVIFSRKAVKQINLTNEEGRGLATAGLICGIVGIFLNLFVVLAFLSFFSFSPVDTVPY